MNKVFFEQKQEMKKTLIEAVIKNLSEIYKSIYLIVGDLKVLLYDIDSIVRGLGGCKKAFEVEKLPTIIEREKEQTKLLNSVEKEFEKTETIEEKLERHKNVFSVLTGKNFNK